MPNYTGLESRGGPFSSFIAGMGAADQQQHTALQNEASRAVLDQQKQGREAAKLFQATGDPRELRGYDPALAVTIRK